MDEYGDVLWRLRALYGIKNTVGSRIVCIGGASGWGVGGQEAPRIARELWKLDLRDLSYKELGPCIQAARNDPSRVVRAFLLSVLFRDNLKVELRTRRFSARLRQRS